MSLDDDIERIGTAINQMQRLLSSRRVHSRLASTADVALTQQATQILLVLDTAPSSIADVAATAHMDVGAASRQITVLEGEGLATRRASQSHGRVVLVQATELGLAIRDRLKAVRSRHLVDALDGWTAAERKQLGRLLLRLVQDLQATPYQRTAPPTFQPMIVSQS